MIYLEGKVYGDGRDIRIRIYSEYADKLRGQDGREVILAIIPVVKGRIYENGDIRIRIYSEYRDIMSKLIGERVGIIVL